MYLAFCLPVAYYWLLITELAPRNDKIVYRITYKVYRILCYIYGLMKLNTVMLITIFLSLRRERLMNSVKMEQEQLKLNWSLVKMWLT